MKLRPVFAFVALAACAPIAPTPAPVPLPLPREFRGVWVASVSNIDWPSARGLAPDAQKRELVALLDRAVAVGLNAVILQIRPAADALYASSLEPWSPYLTGRMGVAPEPFYDPLAFAVEEAHRRGLELHAWFNPYRARHPSDSSEIAPTHISVRRPDLVKRYGRYLWMDPGEPEVLEHTKSVILDVVRRYDIDGVHIDDYFYPYQERDSTGALIDFPDDPSWARYVAGGGLLQRHDWRRENVDRLVGQLYFAIREAKPWVKFGVSPFGIWRPGHPAGVTGFDAYAAIYADAKKWFNNGWLDYFAPQLYWRISSPGQPFAPLLAWWANENTYRRHLWPGLYTSRSDTVESATRWRATEIVEQIRLERAEPVSSGHIHYSARAFRDDRDSVTAKVEALYRTPALVPPTWWADGAPPAPPRVFLGRDSTTGGLVAHLRPGDDERPRFWLILLRYGRDTRVAKVAGTQDAIPLTASRRQRTPREIVVTAIDRSGNESAPSRARVR